MHGLDVVIETPKGYERHGKTPDGKPWSTVLPYDYGYFVNQAGADGDSLDVALGPDPTSEYVYVFDQQHLPPRKGFDESKVFANFASQKDALQAFDAGHHLASQVLMDFTPMSVDEFHDWLARRNPKKPCSSEVRG